MVIVTRMTMPVMKAMTMTIPVACPVPAILEIKATRKMRFDATICQQLFC